MGIEFRRGLEGRKTGLVVPDVQVLGGCRSV